MKPSSFDPRPRRPRNRAAAGACLFLALLALGGCRASAPAAGTRADVASRGYSRVIEPFSVKGPDGSPYRHPFLGGLDVPRPQLVDIDGDGDFDMFIQERSAELMFFENTGSASAARFVWRTDAFHGLDVGEWSRFVDLDRDGDLDILAEQRFSYVRMYRNVGTSSAPRFTAAADTIAIQGGEALFADRQNIPAITDLDCDGLYDLFLGRVDGTVSRYEEAMRTTGDGVPAFRLVTDRFEGIEIIGQLLGSLHGANAMDFADFDGDGDLDLFWGDFFEPGLLLIRNHGSCEQPNLRTDPVPFPTRDPIATSGYNVPRWVDLDGDEDQDLFVGVLGGAFNPNRTAADNLYYLERVRGDSMVLRTRRFLDGIDVGSESVPAVADFDGDGDLDLIVGNKIDPVDLKRGRLYFFRNEGTPTAPALRLADTLGVTTAYHLAPTAGDLDGDGDPDLLVGTWNDGLHFLRNDRGRFVRDSIAIPQLRGGHLTPALGDLDGDGDLDLLVGEGSGEVNLMRNVGTAALPRFELLTEQLAEIDAGRRSHPTLVDVDGDGDLDLVVGSETGGLRYYRNAGSAAEARFVADSSFSLRLHAASAPVFGDLDGDGDPDLLSGTLGGGLLYFERR